MPDFLLLTSGDRLLLADGTSHLLLATNAPEPFEGRWLEGSATVTSAHEARSGVAVVYEGSQT